MSKQRVIERLERENKRFEGAIAIRQLRIDEATGNDAPKWVQKGEQDAIDGIMRLIAHNQTRIDRYRKKLQSSQP